MKCSGCGVELPPGSSTCPGCTYNNSATDGGRSWTALSPEERERRIKSSKEQEKAYRKSRPLLRYADENFGGDPVAALDELLRKSSLSNIRHKLYKVFWPENDSANNYGPEMRNYFLPAVSAILNEGYPGGSKAAAEERTLCKALDMTPEQLRKCVENPFFEKLKKQGVILLAVLAVCAVVAVFSMRAAAFLALAAIFSLGVSPGSATAYVIINALSFNNLKRLYRKAPASQLEHYRQDPELYDKVRDLVYKDFSNTPIP